MPIRLSCSHCGKSYNLKDELAGKRIRCTCSHLVDVPKGVVTPQMPMAAIASPGSSVRSSSNSAPAKPIAKPISKPSSAAVPAAQPKPQAVAGRPAGVAPSSIFDEITENDRVRAQQGLQVQSVGYDPRRDAKALRAYAGKDDEKAKAESQAKGWFVFLGVVHLLWAFLYGGVAVLFIIASAFLMSVADAIPILRLGMAAVIAGTVLLGVWCVATGLGILLVKPWGWWLGVYSMFYGIFDRISGLILSFTSDDEASNKVGYYIGVAVGVLACISFIQLFCDATNMKRYQVTTRPLIAMLICGGLALAICTGTGLAIYAGGESIDAAIAAEEAAR